MKTTPLTKLLRVLERLRAVHSEFPAQAAHALLIIADAGAITLTHLSEEVGLTIGAVSRNVGRLADDHNGVKGMGFITVELAPGSYRQKVATLTAKGERFLADLLGGL